MVDFREGEEDFEKLRQLFLQQRFTAHDAEGVDEIYGLKQCFYPANYLIYIHFGRNNVASNVSFLSLG